LTCVNRTPGFDPKMLSSDMSARPASPSRNHRLADGRCVVIRPIRPEDEAAERAFLDALCDATKRRRFIHRARRVDEELLHYFTHADSERHLAFVCEAGNAIVGDARCVANLDDRSCELGIVVADDWHHTGVAQLLMDTLLDAARAHGFERMQGIVLADNRDMLDFTRELGFEASQGPQGVGTVRIEKRL
jgi:acetyltransferase